MRKHLAQVAHVEPFATARASHEVIVLGLGDPFGVNTAGDHRSRASFRFRQCVSLRSGLNTRSRWRLIARMTPMRANIVGPPSVANRYLRSLFVAGALAVIRYAKIHGNKRRPWLAALLARRPTKVAAIALANKIARMTWAMMAKGERYKESVALAA